MEVKIVAEKRRKTASFGQILWDNELGRPQKSNTPSTVTVTLNLDTSDCHRHVKAIKKYLEA